MAQENKGKSIFSSVFELPSSTSVASWEKAYCSKTKKR